MAAGTGDDQDFGILGYLISAQQVELANHIVFAFQHLFDNE